MDDYAIPNGTLSNYHLCYDYTLLEAEFKQIPYDLCIWSFRYLTSEWEFDAGVHHICEIDY